MEHSLWPPLGLSPRDSQQPPAQHPQGAKTTPPSGLKAASYRKPSSPSGISGLIRTGLQICLPPQPGIPGGGEDFPQRLTQCLATPGLLLNKYALSLLSFPQAPGAEDKLTSPRWPTCSPLFSLHECRAELHPSPATDFISSPLSQSLPGPGGGKKKVLHLHSQVCPRPR